MKRTPIGQISVCISWIIFFAGITLGLYFCYGRLFVLGAIVISASIVLAVLLRLLANVNEFLFNLYDNTVVLLKGNSQIIKVLDNTLQDTLSFHSLVNDNLSKLNSSTSENISTLNKSISEGMSTVNLNFKEALENIKVLEQNLREVNCDSRDINDNLHKLTSFLGEIQGYLHLKK